MDLNSKSFLTILRGKIVFFLQFIVNVTQINDYYFSIKFICQLSGLFTGSFCRTNY